MAWSWSHTQEAYDYARFRLTQLTNEHLIEIYAEWFSYTPGAPGADREDCIKISLTPGKRLAERMTRRELEQVIWDKMSDQATCDNGGWNAWACPYGCHTVPFGKKEKE